MSIVELEKRPQRHLRWKVRRRVGVAEKVRSFATLEEAQNQDAEWQLEAVRAHKDRAMRTTGIYVHRPDKPSSTRWIVVVSVNGKIRSKTFPYDDAGYAEAAKLAKVWKAEQVEAASVRRMAT